MPLTKEELADKIRARGLNPDEYDLDAAVNAAPAPTQQPTSDLTRGQAAWKVGKRSILPTLGGGLGAAGGSALLSGLGPIGTVGGAILGGLGGGVGTSYGQEKALEAIQGPEKYAADVNELKSAEEKYPFTSFLAGTAPMLMIGRPSISGLKNLGGAISKIGRGGLTEAEILAAKEAGMGAGINTGTDIASQKFVEDKENLDYGRVAGAAGLGALFTKPNLLGRSRLFGFKGSEQQQPISNTTPKTEKPFTSLDFYGTETNELAGVPWTSKDSEGKYLVPISQVNDTLSRLYPDLYKTNKILAENTKQVSDALRLNEDIKRYILETRTPAPTPDTPQAPSRFEQPFTHTTPLEEKLNAQQQPVDLTAKTPLRTAQQIVGDKVGIKTTDLSFTKPSYKQGPEKPANIIEGKPISNIPILEKGSQPTTQLIHPVESKSKPLTVPITEIPSDRPQEIPVKTGEINKITPSIVEEPPKVEVPITPAAKEVTQLKPTIEAPKGIVTTPKDIPVETKYKAPFETLGPGHEKFAKALAKLSDEGTLHSEHAEVIREVLRDVDDNLLNNIKVDSRSNLRSLGMAKHTFDDERLIHELKITLQKGLQQNRERNVGTNKNYSSVDAGKTFLHEFGHISDYAILTDKERQTVVDVFTKLSKQPGGLKEFFNKGFSKGSEHYTNYYAHSPSEFWAESFAEYALTKASKVPELRSMLERVYKIFSDAIKRIMGREGYDPVKNELHPLFEKILSGEGKLRENIGTTINKLDYDPSPSTISSKEENNKFGLPIEEQVSRATLDDLLNNFKDYTRQALRLGVSKKTPEEIDNLRLYSEKAKDEFKKAVAANDLRRMVAAGQKQQFFNEAIQAATGTGSGGETAKQLGLEPSVKGYDFGRSIGNNEHVEFDPSPIPTDNPVETESNKIFTLPILRSAIDEIRRLGPTGEKVANAVTGFYEKFSRGEGRYVYPISKLLTKDFSIFKNPREWITLDSPSNKRVNEYLNDMFDFKESKVNLTADEVRKANSIRDFYNLVADDQLSRGIPVWDAQGHPRTRGKDPNYHAQVIDNKVINTILNDPTSSETIKFKQDYVNYQIEKGSREGKTVTLADAQKRLNDVLESFTGTDFSSNVASQYGPIDKTEGYGIPRSWREQNLVNLLARYGRRIARRFAYYDSIESNPEARYALGIKRDVMGNPTEPVAGVEPIAGSDVVKTVMKNVAGQTSRAELKRDAVSAVVRSAMLGFGTGAVDFTTNLTLGLQHFTPTQAIRSVVDSWKNIRSNLEESFKSGVNRLNIGALETNQAGMQEAISALHRFRDVVNVVQGRNLFEQMARATAFGQGKFVAADNLWFAHKNGGKLDGQRSKFMESFGPANWKDYVSAGEFPPEIINEMAAKYVESVQGTYDYRGLPAIAVEGSLSPFLSLSRWNIEKANNFTKYVINPALKGEFTPLLMSTLGLVIGGTAVKELRELMSGKKEKIPQPKEIIATNPANAQAWFYKVAALTDASGYAGMLGNLARSAGDIAYKNPTQGFTNPLIHAGQQTMGTVADAVQALEDGDFSVGIDTLSSIIEDYTQTYRIALSAMARVAPETAKEKSEEIKSANNYRDLRVFKQLNNLPAAEISKDKPNKFTNQDVRSYKSTDDVGEASQLLQKKIVPDLISRFSSSPDILRSRLRGLAQNSAQDLPSPESSPYMASKYLDFLRNTQGDDRQQQLLSDYLRKRNLNQVKAGIVPKI